jgi:hypothetical protein
MVLARFCAEIWIYRMDYRMYGMPIKGYRAVQLTNHFST